MVRPEIRFKVILFAILFLASDLARNHFSSSRESYHIVRAGLDTDTTAGTEFGPDIKVNGFPVLYRVDLFLCRRFEGIQLECIHRTCNDAVATTGALLHVNMYRKRHAYHTLVVVISIVDQQVS
jgi:hypothetical protein